jgi:rare lipoprotein A
VIVPTLCVGTPHWTLCVRFCDAERHGLHSHAERGNDHGVTLMKRLLSACALLSLLAGCASTDVVDPHGYDKTGVASYYGAKHHGKRTASGERFNQHGLTAAHRQLPFGTRVKITNLNNDRSCVVRVNDRGPYSRGRLIDVSREAAEQLGMLRSGTAKVRVQALDD